MYSRVQLLSGMAVKSCWKKYLHGLPEGVYLNKQ